MSQNDVTRAASTEAAVESSGYVHPSAEVSPDAIVGSGVRIWNEAQVRERAQIGTDTIISKNVYVGPDVRIGRNCKIQNNVSVYTGVTLEDGVFVGPHVCFTNDRVPRAINQNGTMKSENDWEIIPTTVAFGASIGAHSVLLPGVRVGVFSMVGAGSVVTKDVPDHALVLGAPARIVGYVCACGARLTMINGTSGHCSVCDSTTEFG